MRSGTFLQKMSNRVQLHDLPGQRIGPALPAQYLCSRSKIPSSPKTTTRDFQLLIPLKQNPHTQINQPAVTAKIISQPGIQLFVELWLFSYCKQNFMGCMKDFPVLFNIQVSYEHRSHL